MSRIIFDIETSGKDFDSLPLEVQEYLLKNAETDEEETEVKESLALYPVTGEIVTICVLNPDSRKGAAFYQNGGAAAEAFEEDGIRYESGDEAQILKRFWETVKTYNAVVSFNGRSFDSPYILVRSAIHSIKPTRDLMPNRYGDGHIDLLDQLTFYGASRRRFSLDMWCRTFNVESPKSDGISGKDVQRLFREGKYLDIAKYCAGDVKATAQVFEVWENYIKYSPYKPSK